MTIRRLILVLAMAPAVVTVARGQGPRTGWAVSVRAGEPLSRIAFESCASQERPQPIWDAVLAVRPQLMLFLGDNIDADTRDMDVMRAKYAKLAAMPGFRALRRSCPILATRDDHDLRANDAGSDDPIDWDRPDPRISLEARGVGGTRASGYGFARESSWAPVLLVVLDTPVRGTQAKIIGDRRASRCDHFSKMIGRESAPVPGSAGE